MEPSHITIGLSLFYFLAINNYYWYKKNFGIYSAVILVIIFILTPSASLLVIISLCFLLKIISNLHINFRQFIRFLKWAILFILFIFIVLRYSVEVNERMSGVFDNMGGNMSGDSNISSLIYVKGFQMASYGLSHYPLGVGFLNMVLLNEHSSVSQLSPDLYEICKDSGSSMLFKIVSEFGIFGFLFFIGSAFRLFKLVRKKQNIFEQALLFAFVASAVRGASYFDGANLIAIAIYINFLKLKINQYTKLSSPIMGRTS